MELITVDEMDGLPSDPAAAFVQLERICRTRLGELLSYDNREYDTNSLRNDYMIIVAAAAKTYGVVEFESSEYEDYTEQNYERLRRKAMFAATQMGLDLKSRREADTVSLSEGPKARLRKHLTDLQNALAAAELPPERAARLKAKLAVFSKELDKERSNLTLILVGIAAVASAIPNVEDSIIKLPQTINAIMMLIGKEKLFEEESAPPQIALPTSVERKALTGPSNRQKSPAARPSAFDDDLNDDVPF